MKICKRALNRIQIYNENGDVRICGFIKNDKIGNLLEKEWKESTCMDAFTEVKKI